MQSSQAVGIRKYILYFLFMFLSGLLTAVDYFSNKSLSNYIPNQVNLISSFQLSDRFLQNEFINGVPFFGQVLTDVPGKDLRGLIDEQKMQLVSGVIVLISGAGGKAAIAAGVTDDLTDSLSAVELVKVAAKAVGGKGGGGRPDMAQGGGPSAKNAEAALDAVRKILEG